MKVKAKINDSFVMRKIESKNQIKVWLEFETEEDIDFSKFKEVEIDIPIMKSEKISFSNGREISLTEEEINELKTMFSYPVYVYPNKPYSEPYPFPIITCKC